MSDAMTLKELRARQEDMESYACVDAAIRELAARKHCDDCGCTWLDDGLNPVTCPYCALAALKKKLADAPWADVLIDNQSASDPDDFNWTLSTDDDAAKVRALGDKRVRLVVEDDDV